ncbi:antifungal protein ginkbilobin-like protein [Salvia miltiorrhiza]|uniref:antifungal protein ginkbilobin-like protein n=1 Tax=Salvia miltiorrhiza TaxID=226208 RepID=UPI0025AC0CBE|nr:antifungal protein ginkbilobin-like protein [Salvia miltiorrhiza]
MDGEVPVVATGLESSTVETAYSRSRERTPASPENGSPNTSINYLACNVNGYLQGDAYAGNVAYVLADMMNVTPNAGYDYYTHSPSSTAVCYGHATCSLALSYNDCADCLTAARSTVLAGCPSSIGASVEMVDCTIRYENYFF